MMSAVPLLHAGSDPSEAAAKDEAGVTMAMGISP
jgi:hypothetical protein